MASCLDHMFIPVIHGGLSTLLGLLYLFCIIKNFIFGSFYFSAHRLILMHIFNFRNFDACFLRVWICCQIFLRRYVCSYSNWSYKWSYFTSSTFILNWTPLRGFFPFPLMIFDIFEKIFIISHRTICQYMLRFAFLNHSVFILQIQPISGGKYLPVPPPFSLNICKTLKGIESNPSNRIGGAFVEMQASFPIFSSRFLNSLAAYTS